MSRIFAPTKRTMSQDWIRLYLAALDKSSVEMSVNAGGLLQKPGQKYRAGPGKSMAATYFLRSILLRARPRMHHIKTEHPYNPQP